MAVFLLREWILQNARPGVFEDEDPLPEDPFPVLPQHPQQLGPVPPPPRLVFADPPRRALPVPPIDPPPPRPIEGRELHPRMDVFLAMETADLRRQNVISPVASDPSRWDIEGHRDRRPKKKKNKVKQSDDEDDDVQRKMEKDAEIRRRMFRRRIHIAKTTAVRHRMTTRRIKSSSPSPSPPREVDDPKIAANPKHEFTFTASFFESSGNLSPEGQSLESSVDLTTSWQSLPTSTSLPALPTAEFSQDSSNQDQLESPFPSVTLQPPSGSIPFSLRPSNEPPPPYPTRPVLPTTPLPLSGSVSPFLYSPGRANSDSSSHSTYLAPEELAASLEAGPSDYFARESGNDQRGAHLANGKMKEASASQLHDSDDDTESLSDLDQEDIQAEHDRYFGNIFDTQDEFPPPALESLTDSESDVTTEDDGRAIGDLDDEDGQPAVVFGVEGAAVAVAGEGNVAREDGLPQGQAAPVVNQPAGEGPAAANGENEEADANVEDDMEGAMEGLFFFLLHYLLKAQL